MIKIQNLETIANLEKKEAFITLNRSQDNSYSVAYEILSMARKLGYHLMTDYQNGIQAKMTIGSRTFYGIEEIKEVLSNQLMKIKHNVKEVSERSSDFGR